MEDFPLDEMMDFLKKDDFQDLDVNQDELSKVPDNSSLVDHFMNDPQFWKTFLKEDDMKKTNVYSPSNYNSMLWSHANYTLKDNYASSSSTSSDHSGSSPPHLSEICVPSASEYISQTERNSSSPDNSSPISMMDENSVHLLPRSDESPSPTLSNYDSSVSTIDIGADVIVVTSAEVYPEEEEETGDSDDAPEYAVDVEEKGLQPLVLSEEEKRLMEKEGVVLPKYLPLTKAEERELKRIRRKIRNKASAQNSRKRKKEYIDGLERRVKRCTLENNSLKQTVRQMQEKNKTLVTELSRLQKLLANTSNKPVQSSTCLMVLLCSFALLLLPNLLPSESKDLFDGEKSEQKFTSVRGPSRTLSWTERSSETPGKIHAEGFYKEENVSNLYESPQLGSSPKHSEWNFAAGQHIERAYYPMSDETASFPEDFLMSENKYLVQKNLPSTQPAAESGNILSVPPCVQEVIIDSSPE